MCLFILKIFNININIRVNVFEDFIRVDKAEDCKDRPEEDWINEAEFNGGIPCDVLTCDMLAMAGMCSANISSSPLSSCFQATAGLAKQFCRESCFNCST